MKRTELIKDFIKHNPQHFSDAYLCAWDDKMDLEHKLDNASKKLRDYIKPEMRCHLGLILDNVKFGDSHYRELKTNFDYAMEDMREFDSMFMKLFKKEFQTHRRLAL